MFKDNFITVARAHHLSLSTERAYWDCSRRHIARLKAKSVKDLEKDPTRQFVEHLTALANESPNRIDGDEGVSASTQNSFFHALRFLYEKVVGVKLGDLSGIPRARGLGRIVDVPEIETAKRIVRAIPGINGLACRTIFGTGARLNDILRLRVKDLDFKKKLIAIQQSKGDKARLVPMPRNLIPELKAQISERMRVHESDVFAGYGWAHLPGNLAKKYPNEAKMIGWQYVFASATISKDPRTGNEGRHHIFDVTLQRAFLDARRRLKIQRHYTIHSLRHCTAQWWEAQGVPLSRIQELLGHKNVQTTMGYLKSGIKSVSNVPTPI